MSYYTAICRYVNRLFRFGNLTVEFYTNPNYETRMIYTRSTSRGKRNQAHKRYAIQAQGLLFALTPKAMLLEFLLKLNYITFFWIY